MQIRLQKLLAQSGVASRRASERLIAKGRVQVNGRVVTAMGLRVDLERDEIAVDGRPICVASSRRYIKLHKPRGYLSIVNDDRGRRALSHLVPDVRGLHPVGRLDKDSEGLVVLTDDGALTVRLTHPRYEHTKEYLVLVDGRPSAGALHTLRAGVRLEDGVTAPAQVERVAETSWGPATPGRTWLRFVLHEGRKRQIRRMCGALGYPVRRLIRVRIGPIGLGDLSSGKHRPLSEAELGALRAEIDW